MARQNFDVVMRYILKFEGGYVNDPHDPGGETNYGITQRTYDAWNRRKGRGKKSVRDITKAEAVEIYREQYAGNVRFDDLPAGVDFAVLDFAINSGEKNAVPILQRLLGVRQDGRIGVQTLDAVSGWDAAELVQKLCDARLAFVRRLNTWKRYGRGWSSRIKQVRDVATAMAAQDAPPETVDCAGNEHIRAKGAQSLTASIGASRRSKGAVAGVAGTALAAIPEAMELARPAQELADFARYAGLVGLLIVACALGYIIWVRCHAVKD